MDIAKSKATRVWAQMIEAWEARLAGDTSDAEARFSAAKNLAEARGYRFMAAGDVAKLPLPIVLGRVQEVLGTSRNITPDLMAADAVLGAANRPPMTISRALERYWEIAQDKTRGKSPDQIRRWRNPRLKAISNFIKVKGDLAVEDVTTSDLVDFRAW